jgi:tRNA dimethylallyltransferase
VSQPGHPAVIALFGPTAVGKTAVAVELARLLRARGEDPVAVSVDSMQVYRELPILTGVADAEQRLELEHRLVGHVSVADNYDVATHAKLAHAEIDQLRAEGRRPIVIGGTGLYLRAALCELELMPKPREGVRERLAAELEQDGLDALYARLEHEAPDLAAEVDPANARRVVRALETIEQGGDPLSRRGDPLWSSRTRVPTQLFALVIDRAVLYAKIEERVDQMIEHGAEAEARGAWPPAGRTARQALGFKELQVGDVQQMKTNTRRYAKRQLTWLNKLDGAQRIDLTELSPAQVAEQIANRLTD